MTVKTIDDFLRENTSRIKQICDRKNTEIGFNAFALVSDVYYRENFHSDIIAAILNPHSGHKQGTLFLRRFVDFLADEAAAKGNDKVSNDLRALTIADSVEVVREEGRVDIKIKGDEWTIIIENKINGARDMDRQIPRYIEECRNVVAVVYLTAAVKGYPSDNGWKKDDKEKLVDPLLIPVIGCSTTPLAKNLANDWIGVCMKEANGNVVKSILQQYAELLRYQSGENMNQGEVKEVMKSMVDHKISYPELTQVLQEIPRVLARTIVDRFSDHPALKPPWLWPPSSQKCNHRIILTETVAVLELKVFSCGGRSITLGIDIWCENFEDEGVTFFSRDPDIEPRVFLPILEGCGFRDGGDDGRLVLDWGLKKDLTNWVYAHQDDFLGKIERILDCLAENRDRMEKIVASVICKEYKAKTQS